MAETGALIITNLTKITSTIIAAKKYVSKTLYIQLNADSKNKLRTATRNCGYAAEIYATTLRFCDQLDVIFIVDNLKKNSIRQTVPINPVDVLIFDNGIPNVDTKQFIDRYQTKNIVKLSQKMDDNDNVRRETTFKWTSKCDAIVGNTVTLTGTFDHLHIGHKMILTKAVFHAKKLVVIGVNDIHMIQKKLLKELILPLETRIQSVQHFLRTIDNTLQYEVVPIQVPFEPIITIPNIDILIVSTDTLQQGTRINQIRSDKKLPELKMYCIDLYELETNEEAKEKKISSSNVRIDLLGTYLNEPQPKSHLPIRPYIIGLTGGIASGKTTLTKYFERLGAAVINCDKLAHEIYEPGRKCYAKLVESFGSVILSTDKQINRQRLGSIVYANSQKLTELNRIVWPELGDEVKLQMEKIRNENTHKIVIIEAAVLLQVGYQHNVHEVWSIILPEEDAIQRIMDRNHFSEEQAKKRYFVQPNNESLVKESNVVFSTLWSIEFTRQQAEKAWTNLQHRINTNHALKIK